MGIEERLLLFVLNAMTDDKKTKRGGFYIKDEKLYLSVSQLKNMLAKPALIYWAAGEVWAELVKNPNLSLEEARGLPDSVRNKAAGRGRTIHSLFEAYKASGFETEQIPVYDGCYQAMKKWIADFNPEFAEQEKTVYSEEHKIAGTLDAIVKIGDERLLIDAKTNKDASIYKEHEIQLSAYAHMAREAGLKVDGVALLALGEDGNYNFKRMTENFDIVLACKTLYLWQNAEMCKKVGYN